MSRQYTPDFEAQLRMLLRSDSKIGTNGTYNAATSEYFNDALGVTTVPNTPSGESFEPDETSIHHLKYQDSSAGFGSTLPYCQVPGEIQRFRGEDVGTPVNEPSTPRPGSVVNLYISNQPWDRNASQTPTLASGSSPSDSGHSEELTPVGTPVNAAEYPQRRRYVHQSRNGQPTNSGLSSSTPSPMPVGRAEQSRPQRASEVQRDRSKCYCPHGCKKTVKDGSRQPLSFTRNSDRKRHCEAKHNDHAQLYKCPECPYKRTRKDKVSKHWKAEHGTDGKDFVPGRSQRVVPEGLIGRNGGRWD